MPEVDESKKNLRYAIIQTLVITAIILVVIVLGSNIWVKTTRDKEIQRIKDSLVQIVDLARNSINDEVNGLREGTLSSAEAEIMVAQKLRHLIYTDIYGENYIFMVNYKGAILVQPYQPWLENTDQWNMQDANGKFLIREILKIKDTPEGKGFVTYFYKPPNLSIEEEKLSYIIDVPELECVIGTGIYMRLYYESETGIITRTTIITCLFAFLVLLITLIPLHRIRITGLRLEQEIIKRGEMQLHLQESELNLRSVFNTISDALFVHTETGEILEINDRVEEMFGCKKEDIIGKPISIISNPGDYHQDRMLSLWKRIMTGESFVKELRALKLDKNEPFFVEAAMQKGIWFGREVIIAVVRDIQKRKFIERELLRNQILSEQAESIGNYGNFSIDFESLEFFWSKGVYQIFQRDEGLPPPGFDEYHRYIHPDDFARVLQTEKQPRVENRVTKTEYRIILNNNEIRYLLQLSTWLSTEDHPFLVGSIRDITEQRNSMVELSEREEKFRTTVQQMKDGLLILDEQGKVIEWNNATGLMTGMPESQSIGIPIWELLPKIGVENYQSLSMEELEAEIDSMRKTGESKFFHDPQELSIQALDGKHRILLQTIFPIRTNDKFRVGVLSHDITEQKASLERINHELEKLESLRSIDASILERSTPEDTLQLICSIAVNRLQVDGAIILTHLSKSDTAYASYSKIDTTETPLVADLLETQISALKKGNITKFSHDDLLRLNLIKQIDPVTGAELDQAILPLTVNKKISGYMQVISRNPIPEDKEWNDYFITLAGQTSLAVENVTLIANEENAYNELNRAYEATIAGWSKALELRDEETQGHSDRVMHLTCRLAQKIGFPQDRMTSLRRGVLLHDIGKMGIPDRILLKPGPLTPEEWKIMKQHPVMAYDLLSMIPYLHESLDVPYCHHERWDGSGYPRGLKGKDIPLSARIFSLVDVWDALISDRPYRAGWEPDKIRAYIRENSGKLFDPELVEIFLSVVENFPDYDMNEDNGNWV